MLLLPISSYSVASSTPSKTWSDNVKLTYESHYTGFKPVITGVLVKDWETTRWVDEGAYVVIDGRSTHVRINGTAYSTNPNTTILKVEIKIGSRDWVVANGTTNWSYLWDLTQVTDADLAAINYTGNFTIFVRAWDGYTYSEYYSFTLDYFPPGGLYYRSIYEIMLEISIICLVILLLFIGLRFRKKRT